MNTILKKIEGEIRYLVEYDPECVEGSFDFGNEKENAEYLARFESGELSSYLIVKQGLCKCCKGWECIDAICAIHAGSAEEALAYYKAEHEVTGHQAG